MKLVQLEQGTQEWLEWRKGLITASDVPIIMGVSPYSTARELWERRKGLLAEVQDNPGMRRGRELEPVARDLAEKSIDGFFQPACCQSDEYPFMGASLDGLALGTGDVLEAKCPSEDDHLIAMNGNVPSKYLPQVQAQAIATGCNKLYYASYRPGAKQEFVLLNLSGAELRLQADQSKLVERVRVFWESLESDTYPLSLEQTQIAQAWAHAQIALDAAKAEEERLREQLLSLVDKEMDRQEINGVLITRSVRQGAIDYKAVLKALNVDPPEDVLKDARKKDSISYRLTLRADRVEVTDTPVSPLISDVSNDISFNW